MSNKRIYMNRSVGISGRTSGEAMEDFIEDKYPEFAHDPRRVKVIDDTKDRLRGEAANFIVIDEVAEPFDVAVDETPELAQADLKKEDPKEDEIEKTLASYGIKIGEYHTVFPPMYDFPADQNQIESLTINGCQLKPGKWINE